MYLDWDSGFIKSPQTWIEEPLHLGGFLLKSIHIYMNMFTEAGLNLRCMSCTGGEKREVCFTHM